MRKLNINKKDVNTLQDVNSSCACIAYCGNDAMRSRYQEIQMNTAHAGDPGPFSINEEV